MKSSLVLAFVASLGLVACGKKPAETPVPATDALATVIPAPAVTESATPAATPPAADATAAK